MRGAVVFIAMMALLLAVIAVLAVALHRYETGLAERQVTRSLRPACMQNAEFC